jgi:fructose-1-phosphate kinase PfkB-like protein
MNLDSGSRFIDKLEQENMDDELMKSNDSTRAQRTLELQKTTNINTTPLFKYCMELGLQSFVQLTPLSC